MDTTDTQSRQWVELGRATTQTHFGHIRETAVYAPGSDHVAVTDSVDLTRGEQATYPTIDELVDKAKQAEGAAAEKRRAAARKAAETRRANRDAAIKAVADSDEVETEAFLALIRTWANRKGLCTSLEGIIQRELGVLMLESDYDDPNYDKVRLTPAPGQPATISKEVIAKTVKVVKRDYHSYWNSSIQAIIDKLGLPEPVIYNDTFEVITTYRPDVRRMRERGYTDLSGNVTEEQVRQYARDYPARMHDYLERDIKYVTIPDPKRALDAAATAATPPSTVTT